MFSWCDDFLLKYSFLPFHSHNLKYSWVANIWEQDREGRGGGNWNSSFSRQFHYWELEVGDLPAITLEAGMLFQRFDS